MLRSKHEAGRPLAIGLRDRGRKLPCALQTQLIQSHSNTHKLNFEWDTALAVFRRLPEGHWAPRRGGSKGSLNYVATGLPKAGDEVGGETFVTDASPCSFSLVVVIPLTR